MATNDVVACEECDDGQVAGKHCALCGGSGKRPRLEFPEKECPICMGFGTHVERVSKDVHIGAIHVHSTRLKFEQIVEVLPDGN